MKVWKQILIIVSISFIASIVSHQLAPINTDKLDPLAMRVEDFSQKEANSLIILDVRTKEKFAKGHFPNAIHFDPADWENSFALLMERFTGQEIILAYCESGCGSSKNIVKQLREAGLDQCFFVHKGFEALMKKAVNQ